MLCSKAHGCFFTFVPSTAFVVICHHLAYEELRKRRIGRNAVQHSTEFANNRHELDGALMNKLVRRPLKWRRMSFTCLENWPGRNFSPLRVFYKCIRCYKIEGAKICDGIIQLREEDIHQKVVQEGG